MTSKRTHGLAAAPLVLLGLAALACACLQSEAQDSTRRRRAHRPIKTYFSPKGGGAPATIAEIDSARRTIDIAMYSMSVGDTAPIYSAIGRAGDRNVRMRMILHKANSGMRMKQKSLALEKMGVDVRYVSRTMHEKFCIVDGKVLCNGSANWSKSADQKYSENTQVIVFPRYVVRRFKGEFRHLLSVSRDFDPEVYAP